MVTADLGKCVYCPRTSCPLTPSLASHYYSPLMSKALPERIQPLRLAERGASLSGSVTAGQMPRLSEMLAQGGARADFALRFDRDDAGASRVRGRIDAKLVVICQRCLGPMEIDIEREVHLGLVSSDAEAAALDASYDPLVIGEEPISLAGLLEDELILAMPNFSRHPRGECEMPPGADAVEAAAEDGSGQVTGDAGEPGEDNPFSVLESLKSRKSP